MTDSRMTSALALLVPMLLLLLGCAGPASGPAPSPTPAAPPPRACASEPAAALAGRPFDAAVQAEAQRLSGARSVRVIRPGQAVTMDFNAYRLNIELDGGGRVVRLRCS
ncbi:MAG: starvation-inducible protein [Ramlibacter sp.]|jgi:hypothetical protein|nr:starvation-inducible protein [Ramlibacter sp.]